MKTKTENEGLTVMPFPANCEIAHVAANCLKQVIKVTQVDNLRQRDFSVVARVHLENGSITPTFIYKKVTAPWHCEAHIMRFVKDCGLPNVPLLLASKMSGDQAEILQEDVGTLSLCDHSDYQLATLTGLALAQTHDRALENAQYPQFFTRLDNREKIIECFGDIAYKLGALFPDYDRATIAGLIDSADEIAEQLSLLDCCLQHGDLYGENIVLKDGNTPVFIDWSYFCFIGPRLYDLATLTSGHSKNGTLGQYRQALIEGYAAGAGMNVEQIESMLPSVLRLSRLLFLQWLLVRVQMGITQTTVGPVRPLIDAVVNEILD